MKKLMLALVLFMGLGVSMNDSGVTLAGDHIAPEPLIAPPEVLFM